MSASGGQEAKSGSYFSTIRIGDDTVHITNLRKLGGSVMLAVPPAFLDQLHLQAGTTVGMVIDDGRLVVEPRPRPRYTLSELLAISEYAQPQPPEEREWVDAPATGGEML